MIRFVNAIPCPHGQGFFNEEVCRNMDIVGKSYHLKDSFFLLVNDDNLMKNKENGHYRPHYFCIADPKIKGIYWAIPQSSRVEKYKGIMLNKIAKSKSHRCDTIVIGNFGGKENAFLVQNMFPIIEKYISHEHLVGGVGVKMHSELCSEIETKALTVLNLHKDGVKLLFPDVDKIYNLMKNELMSSW